MLKYEWKKLLFYRKGLLLIVLFLAAELFGLLCFTTPFDRELEANRDVYESYLAQVRGPLTPEKRTFLEEEMARLNAVHQEMDQLKQDYYMGNISGEKYDARFPVLLEDEERYVGFSKLYTQYVFVRETERRSFLYMGGWETLLTQQSPDYLFLLLLLALLTPVFCGEYRCHMHEILLTQQKSAKAQVPAKLFMALSLTAALTAFLQFSRLAYCALRFGLPDGGCTLQSLYSFGDSPRNFTLWQAFWFRFAVTELGYLYAALLILALSVLLKKVSLTVMSGIALLPLPFLATGGGESLRYLPGPWPLTIATVFLKGGEYPIETRSLCWILGGSLGILVFLAAWITEKNRNYHCRKGPHKIVAGCCLAALLFTGCSAADASPVCYTAAYSNTYETAKYVIRYDPTGFGFLIENKETGDAAPFPMTGTSNQTTSCTGTFFGAGNTVYYIRENTYFPNSGYPDSVRTSYDLVELDLSQMKEKVRYHWGNDEWFFGLLKKPGEYFSPSSINTFWVRGNDLYYCNGSSAQFYRMSLLTGIRSSISIPDTTQLAYDGRCVYYPDDYHRLVIYDLDTGLTTIREDINTGSIYMSEDGLYFQNRKAQNKLYLWDILNDTIQEAETPPEWIVN